MSFTAYRKSTINVTPHAKSRCVLRQAERARHIGQIRYEAVTSASVIIFLPVKIGRYGGGMPHLPTSARQATRRSGIDRRIPTI
jgi:hypothetical protein